MKRGDEDRLIQFAFGELDEREARQIEERLAHDAEAAALVAEFQSLRQDFRGLEPIPPTQFSADRLRHAIEAAGTPVVRPHWLRLTGWAVPVAAFAVGLLVMKSLQGGAPQPRIITSPTVATQVPAPKVTIETKEPPKAVEVQPKLKIKAPVRVAVVKHTPKIRPFVVEPAKVVASRSAGRKEAAPRPTSSAMGGAMAKASPTIAEGTGKPDQSPGASGTTADMANADRLQQQPDVTASVVIIRPEPEITTGANSATELISTEDVLISG